MDRPSQSQKRKSQISGRAFTLIEMLVVVGIVSLIAVMAMPALRGLTKGDTMTAATRQLLDDLNLARSMALSTRSTVYVVFVPRYAYQFTNTFLSPPVPYSANELNQLTNLVAGQQTAYALYAERSVGDQPGQQNPRYLTDWKFLPEHTFIDDVEFLDGQDFSYRPFPFPRANSPVAQQPVFANGSSYATGLPYLAFNSQGQLVSGANLLSDALIALSSGSVMPPRLPNGRLQPAPPDIMDNNPPINSGEIVEGIQYLVAGSGTLDYGGTYFPGEVFRGGGGPGAENFTPSGNIRVKVLHGVEIKRLTGRGRIVRPQLQ